MFGERHGFSQTINRGFLGLYAKPLLLTKIWNDLQVRRWPCNEQRRKK